MKQETFKYTTKDKTQLFIYKWLPKEEPKAVLLLIHGSVEHAYRYKRFAEYLTANQIAVVAPDLRGHGETTKINGQISYLGKNGWHQAVEDINEIKLAVQKDFPQKPLFIFGHSMGSMIVRSFLAKYAAGFSGAVLMGTTIGEPLKAKVSLFFIKLLTLFKKDNIPSTFLNNQIYGSFNRSVPNPETPVDFISRDKEEVQKYINDPYCGAVVTINYAQQLAYGSVFAAKPVTFKATPQQLPILIVSGQCDPVGGKNSIGVKKVYTEFKKSGNNNVEFKLFENARHELLNEINRQEVSEYIYNWMAKNI